MKSNDLETAWKPTPHGIALAKGMTKVPHAFCGKSMIEIDTGSGIHAILALKLGIRYMGMQLTLKNLSFLKHRQMQN